MRVLSAVHYLKNKEVDLNMSQIFSKILSLIEKDEVEFAYDLVMGSNSEELWEMLFKGMKIDDGVLIEPDWVSWEAAKKNLFLRLLNDAPQTSLILNAREKTMFYELCFYGQSDKKLKSDIFQFQNLKYLKIVGADCDSIPEELFALSNLEDLDIRDSSCLRLPKGFSRLKSLRRLDFKSNDLSDECSNLKAIAEISTLEILVLDYCCLVDFPDFLLRNFKNLKSISLKGNQLSERGLLSFFKQLEGAFKLEEIFLPLCGISKIPEIDLHLPNLKRFDLGSNQLKEIPGFLRKLPNLQWLNLAGNPVFESGKDLTLFHSQHERKISEKFNFSHLELPPCALNTKMLVNEFPRTELSPKNESYLYQLENWLKSVTADNFDQSTFDQKIEEILDSSDDELLIELFRGCSLEENGVLLTGVHFPFPHWAVEMFPSRNLEGREYENLDEDTWVVNVKNRDAAFYHYFMLRLLPSVKDIGQLDPSLRIESIFKMNVSIPGILPPEIRYYKGLIELDITGNLLQDLPDEIAELENLQFLQLDHNQLRVVPSALGKLKKLKYLGLHANKISSFECTLEKLKTLEVLDLSRNNLRKLPESLFELTNLKFLGASHNELKELPSIIGKLNSLRYLFLGENEIKDLPEELYRMDHLQFVGLSGDSCFPKDTEWAVKREVQVSPSAKSMMIAMEDNVSLREQIKVNLIAKNNL